MWTINLSVIKISRVKKPVKKGDVCSIFLVAWMLRWKTDLVREEGETSGNPKEVQRDKKRQPVKTC